MKKEMTDKIYQDLTQIRTRSPLIHNVTNFVVMQQTANALLALGAAPIMAHAVEELPELIRLASALVINIGTLDSYWINAMQTACQHANTYDVPIIIDPVGAGASQLRTKTVHQLLKNSKIAVVRGNASEIMALTSAQQNTKGVESQHRSDQALVAANQLAAEYNCIVVVSGKIDICVSKHGQIHIYNGHEMMTKVTGMGCSATALIAAFCAVNPDYFSAAVHAMTTMGVAGELAAASAKGPGSFAVNFFDELYHLNSPLLLDKICVEIATN